MKNFRKSLLTILLSALIAFGSVSVISAQPQLGDEAVLLGDANLDGKVNIKDATDIQKLIAKIKEPSEISEPLSDVNEDSIVNIKDASEIQKWLAQISANDKIGKPLTQQPESTPTTPSNTDSSSEITSPASTETTAPVLSDPVESSSSVAATEGTTTELSFPSATAASSQAPTVIAPDPTETTVVTEPMENTEPTEPTENTDNTQTPPAETEAPTKAPTEAPTEIPTETPTETPTEPQTNPEDYYRTKVMDRFTDMGYKPYEEGMFFELIYTYYGETTQRAAAQPKAILIWASIGAVADEAYEITVGDYVIMCPGHCYPYGPGYFVFIPETEELIKIEEAYRKGIDGIRTILEESPVSRTKEVDFKIIEEVRINYYGSDKTELYLLHHSSCEDEIREKFTTGFFDVPEMDIPKDENGFYYDKIYLVSMNVVGGSGASQWIHTITVANGALTVYRTINQPINQPPDMNYQFVLIELDASLLNSISVLEDVSEVRTTGNYYS